MGGAHVGYRMKVADNATVEEKQGYERYKQRKSTTKSIKFRKDNKTT